jgi:hypothetical protein
MKYFFFYHNVSQETMAVMRKKFSLNPLKIFHIFVALFTEFLSDCRSIHWLSVNFHRLVLFCAQFYSKTSGLSKKWKPTLAMRFFVVKTMLVDCTPHFMTKMQFMSYARALFNSFWWFLIIFYIKLLYWKWKSLECGTATLRFDRFAQVWCMFLCVESRESVDVDFWKRPNRYASAHTKPLDVPASSYGHKNDDVHRDSLKKKRFMHVHAHTMALKKKMSEEYS